MGLFSKSEVCPICGGEIKGLFLKKIADKKTLCKDCAKQVSMEKELLKKATPEYIKEHLAYRRKNAERFTAANWDAEYDSHVDLKLGVDLNEKILYLKSSEMDNEDNPTVFSFDQITGYELYRLTKKVDSAEEPGESKLESTLSKLGAVAQLAGNSSNNNYFKFIITTTDPYWPKIEIKSYTSASRLYGIGGDAKIVKGMCQVLKCAARREPVEI